MDADPPCQFLTWDTEFFGCRVARLNVNRLNRGTLDHVLTWCDSHRIDCLYFLADAADECTVRLAEECQFRFVDIRLAMDKQLDGLLSVGAQGIVRSWRPDDIPGLRAIARVSHGDSRFYHDTSFPASLCDALYETWIEESCRGYADAVLVADLDGEPAGYVTCHCRSRAEGQIGLLAVSAARRGHGVGEQLLNESLRWFAAQGLQHVTVVTQGRNCSAQRFYQRQGFLTRSLQLWFHRWFSQHTTEVTG